METEDDPDGEAVDFPQGGVANGRRRTFEQRSEAVLHTLAAAVERIDMLGARQHELLARSTKAMLDGGLICDHQTEIVRLRGLLDLARRPLLEHEAGEECEGFMEQEEGEPPHCWVCKLRDDTNPEPKT